MKNFQKCFHYSTFFTIPAGGRTIAHQRSFEDPRIKGANGTGLAKRERRTSKTASGNGDVSERLAADVIRGITPVI